MLAMTAIDTLKAAARAFRELPEHPYAPDRWAVIFADLGHTMVPLHTLPAPEPGTAFAHGIADELHTQGLASYEVTAPDAHAAEQRAREYFAAEHAAVKPWSDRGFATLPYTQIPAEGGPTVKAIATKGLASFGLSPRHDGDAGNTWLYVYAADTKPGPGVPFVCVYVRNAHRGEITVDRPLKPGDEWAVEIGDGRGVERPMASWPADKAADAIRAAADWLDLPRS